MLRTIPIPPELDRARLDEALHAVEPRLSRAVSRRLCEAGAVARAGVRAAARDRVRAGDAIAYDPDTVKPSLALRLGVVHDDAECCVVHKPPGLAVHGGPLVKDSVAARLAKTLPEAGLAQRLDRGTSGLLLVGKDSTTLGALARALEARQVERTYLAWGVGTPARGTFTIEAPLRVLDEPMGNRPKVVVDLERGERAVTHARVVGRSPVGPFPLTLLELTLETGRTHQVRAHLAHAGLAVLGDPRYGDAAANAFARGTLGVARPLLHATRLTFPHPRTGERIACEAFGEPDFARVRAYAGRAGAAADSEAPVNGEDGRGSARRPTSPPTPKGT